MKTFLKMIVAAIVAVGMACVAIAHDASDNLVIVTLFATGIAVSALLGVYDIPAERKDERAMHSGSRFKVQGSKFNKAA